MTSAFLVSNLLFWSLQITVIIGVAIAVPRLLGLTTPQIRLALWQLVLLTCVALPVISPWKHDVMAMAIGVSTAVVSTPAIPKPLNDFPVSIHMALLLVAGAGVLSRTVLLSIGLFRLHRYRRRSTPLSPASPWGSEAELRISPEIKGPVTFGYRSPVVLLPQSFRELNGGMQDAILCHEILHVLRRDWLFTLGEESIRALLWFHPAIWWLLREIQLAREQAVDREVVDTTTSRDQYIDALLTIAGASPSDLAPAPLFLRKRHLKQRIASILKEVRMSKVKTGSAFAASLALVGVSCWLITGVFPLQGAPQIAPDGNGVSVDIVGAELLHREPIGYPLEAVVNGVQGNVVADLKLDSAGNVADATIVSGPQELRKAVLQSVLNWHFAPGQASSREVVVTFTPPASATQNPQAPPPPPPPPPPSTALVKHIRILGLSDQARDQLMAQLPVGAGDTLTAEKYSRLISVVHAFDSHLAVIPSRASATETDIIISRNPANAAFAPGTGSSVSSDETNLQAVRVDGHTQSANLITQIAPVYPPLAKAAHVQGTVSFEATIGKDGKVENLKFLSGPPLLIHSAMVAVQQWVYKPTIVDGNPVEVTTNVDVNYTLSE